MPVRPWNMLAYRMNAPQFHSARDCGMRCALVEFQHQGLRIATRLFLCHDLMGCITAIQSRLNNFQLRTRLVRCSGSDGDSRPDPGSRASSTRFWDAQSGRRPRHAKPCCPVKGPPASKTRRHLVLMNDSCWSLTKPSICQLSAWRPYGNYWINRRTAGCCSPAPTSWSRSSSARPWSWSNGVPGFMLARRSPASQKRKQLIPCTLS